MKLVLIVNSFPTPSETFLFNLVSGMENSGIDTHVVAFKKSSFNNLYQHRAKEWNGKITYIAGPSILNICKLISYTIKNLFIFLLLKKKVGFKKAIYLSSAYHSIMKNNPDIIHFSFSGIAIQLHELIPILNQKAKTVVSCRGTGEKLKPVVEPGRKEKLQSTLNIVNAIHCVSADMKNVIQNMNVTNKKILINRPAVICQYFRYNKKKFKPANEIFEIVTTGRLSFEKGYAYALNACKKLKESGFYFRYHILGDGPDLQMIRYMVKDLGLENEVIMHGRVSGKEVNEKLQEADIFLLPSIYEGISNAALEAMSTGVPIISTESGGMNEVIINGLNGTIVEKYSSSKLFEGLSWIIRNYDLAIKMSEEARATIEKRHSHEGQILAYLNFYKELINEDNNSL